MEKFKQIKDYSVSNYGRVKSIRFPNRCLKPSNNSTGGYLFVILCKNGVRKTLKVHRLVALAFIPNPENKRTINHIDGIKTNNFVENLEWNTQKENTHHAMDTGLQDNKGTKNVNSKLSEKEVIEIRRLYATGDYYQGALGKIFGVTQRLISYIVRRKNWVHI